MKLIQLLFIAIMLPYAVGAQQKAKGAILTQDMDIAYSKTTTIVFPFPIASVDRGSQDILAQKASGMENVLQLKAAQKGFSDTNLTVITTDGKVYCFTICYNDSPSSLTFVFPEVKQGNLIQFDTENPNARKLGETAEFVFHDRRKAKKITEAKYGITLSLTGFFIDDDLIYYRMKIANATNISYDIDQLRFFVKDQKRSKRTASQEVEIIPVAWHSQEGKVAAQSADTFVCILPKFTIADKKNLVVQLVEKNGGRHLELKVNNKKILAPSLLEPHSIANNDN